MEYSYYVRISWDAFSIFGLFSDMFLCLQVFILMIGLCAEDMQIKILISSIYQSLYSCLGFRRDYFGPDFQLLKMLLKIRLFYSFHWNDHDNMKVIYNRTEMILQRKWVEKSTFCSVGCLLMIIIHNLTESWLYWSRSFQEIVLTLRFEIFFSLLNKTTSLPAFSSQAVSWDYFDSAHEFKQHDMIWSFSHEVVQVIERQQWGICLWSRHVKKVWRSRKFELQIIYDKKEV